MSSGYSSDVWNTSGCAAHFNWLIQWSESKRESWGSNVIPRHGWHLRRKYFLLSSIIKPPHSLSHPLWKLTLFLISFILRRRSIEKFLSHVIPRSSVLEVRSEAARESPFAQKKSKKTRNKTKYFAFISHICLPFVFRTQPRNIKQAARDNCIKQHRVYAYLVVWMEQAVLGWT